MARSDGEHDKWDMGSTGSWEPNEGALAVAAELDALAENVWIDNSIGDLYFGERFRLAVQRVEQLLPYIDQCVPRHRQIDYANDYLSPGAGQLFFTARQDIQEVRPAAAVQYAPLDNTPSVSAQHPTPFDAALAAFTGIPLEVPNPEMVCPHCGVRGDVTTRSERKKAGISGGKATAAVFTGGLSMLATGLSRKERVTVAHCSNCGNTWSF